MTNATPAAEAVASEPRGLHADGVLRNTLFLVVAQVLVTPMSMLINAVLARRLGPGDFGTIYLASTFASCGFLFVTWGHDGAIPAIVARERARAGAIVGSSLVWRFGMTFVVYGLLAGACRVLGYGPSLQGALALVVLGSFFTNTSSAWHDTVRGFERSELTAYALVGQQLLAVVLVVPTVLAGGGLRAALGAQALVSAIVALFVARAAYRIIGSPFAFRKETLRALLSGGSPFLVLGIVASLQPNIDAVFLSRLATPEAIGWQAAAAKLVGVLVFPAYALVSPLYPTLCRLYTEDFSRYCRSTSDALRLVTIIVVPLAVGCMAYPEIGIGLFSEQGFGPATSNLRILSVFVLLVYFSMTLNVVLGASNRQRKWAATQFGCVAISAIADPFLVPWFQRRWGNGGVGICVACVLSETLMVLIGFWIAPRGIVDRALLKGVALGLGAGGAMAMAARLMSGFVPPILAAPIAVMTYAASLWLTGGVDREQLQAIRVALTRKMRRAS